MNPSCCKSLLDQGFLLPIASTDGFIKVPWFGEYNKWTKKSYFESRIEKIPDQKIMIDKVSYMRTGNTLFGISRFHGHGDPGHALELDNSDCVEWFKSCNDEQIVEIYKINIGKKHVQFFDLYEKYLSK
jgi:hypothetical protein